MANNYYDATGVLVLDRITPVIAALFSGFKLDASYPGNGQAYIARIAEDNEPDWDTIYENLVDLAVSSNLPVSTEDIPPMDELLAVFAKHFGADHDEALMNLIEQHGFDDVVDVDALFLIATRFNDGHNLKEICLEGCWHCSKARLFEFGGDGYYWSHEFETFSASGQAIQLGREIRRALLSSDLDTAATAIERETTRLLSGINDEAQRKQLHRRVIGQLSANSEA
ncbi:hypothetical protein [Phytopseudomonas dryadis]|uniref:Uncharacterized protein n=1 Tax=Phytopseudomonas dryadis TaxID=2487520 RepID=A0A4Q9QW87_9GAMM|nr:hypothetical protein [Pseudomonas dryadis]TBU88450.1 hypothetical protein DNK44_18300 [Pseudomonas dryadis]